MALLTKGTAFVFGTGTVTNAQVQSSSITEDFGIRVEVKDADGNLAGEGLGAPQATGDISLLISSAYSVPSPGDAITYDGQAFWIVGVEESASNDGYVEVSLKVEYIASIAS